MFLFDLIIVQVPSSDMQLDANLI